MEDDRRREVWMEKLQDRKELKEEQRGENGNGRRRTDSQTVDKHITRMKNVGERVSREWTI